MSAVITREEWLKALADAQHANRLSRWRKRKLTGRIKRMSRADIKQHKAKYRDARSDIARRLREKRAIAHALKKAA